MLRPWVNISIHRKVTILYLVLLLPLYAFFLYINLHSTNQIKQATFNAMRTQTIFFSTRMQDEISRIMNLLIQLENNSNVLKLLIANDIRDEAIKVKAENNLLDQLKNIAFSSMYIKNTGVYVKNIQQTISFVNGVTDAPNQESDLLFDNPHKLSLRIMFDRVTGSIYLIKETRYYTQDSPSLVVFVQLSREYIQSILDQFSGVNGSGAIITDLDSHWDVSSATLPLSIREALPVTISEAGDLWQFNTLLIKNNLYWISYANIPNLNAQLVVFTPEYAVIGNVKHLWTLFCVLIILSFVLIALYSYSLKRMIHYPIRKLLKMFERLEAENLSFSPKPSPLKQTNDEFSYIYNEFQRISQRLGCSIQEIVEQKNALHRSRLKQLQSQINPHFLYNAFFHIYRMCKSRNYEKLEVFSQRLGSFYQFVTRNDNDNVSLQQEVNHARNYIDIQLMRFSERIHVEFEAIPNDVEMMEVPRLILQPVIENSFKYALEENTQGGELSVSFKYDREILKISIDDNGISLSDEEIMKLRYRLQQDPETDDITSLVNINRRLRLMFGEDSNIFLERSRLGGLCVIMQFKPIRCNV